MNDTFVFPMTVHIDSKNITFFWKAIFSEKGLRLLSIIPEPRATMGKLDSRGLTLKSKIAERLAGEDTSFKWTDLDLSGWPPFYLKIWKAMRAIPHGSVATYGEIASAAGSPGASRACGQACAANPILLLIPCHRVVSAKDLGGFSSGLHTKKLFLELEGVDWRKCKKRRS